DATQRCWCWIGWPATLAVPGTPRLHRAAARRSRRSARPARLAGALDQLDARDPRLEGAVRARPGRAGARAVGSAVWPADSPRGWHHELSALWPARRGDLVDP